MELSVPGDKSLTQRALIFAALSERESLLSGLLHGGDAASTAGALAALGAVLGELPRDGSPLRVRGFGLGGARAPDHPLDLGNSGTGARLLSGVLAGMDIRCLVRGDASLSARPMERVTRPLRAMGAEFEHPDAPGRLPMVVHGRTPLDGLVWESPVASAQVKSAILLAGVTGRAPVVVVEPERSRDHTERMLRSLGIPVLGHAGEGGFRVELREPPERVPPSEFHVPGDFSSAAFFLALGALGGGAGGLTVRGVGLNPTRTAFLEVLRDMGAKIEVSSARPAGAGAPGDSDDHEPSGDVHVASGTLTGTEVGGQAIPSLIDELPLVAVLGARAEGRTRVRNAADLRNKESDRIRVVVENLRAVGATAEEFEDGFEVEGSERPLRGQVRTHGDHRVAMAFGILGAVPGNDIEIDDRACADVSFPGFWDLLERAAGVRR